MRSSGPATSLLSGSGWPGVGQAVSCPSESRVWQSAVIDQDISSTTTPSGSWTCMLPPYPLTNHIGKVTTNLSSGAITVEVLFHILSVLAWNKSPSSETNLHPAKSIIELPLFSNSTQSCSGVIDESAQCARISVISMSCAPV
ncbi:MAG: Uncharacterised protein [Methanobacteriota archaeon]|nr:MAG: Uncharacterised protein [Euryarchaeota archaeon]